MLNEHQVLRNSIRSVVQDPASCMYHQLLPCGLEDACTSPILDDSSTVPPDGIKAENQTKWE